MNPVEPVSIIAINPFHSSRALGEKRSGAEAEGTPDAFAVLSGQGALANDPELAAGYPAIIDIVFQMAFAMITCALKPNQPNHRSAAPRATNGTLWGR